MASRAPEGVIEIAPATAGVALAWPFAALCLGAAAMGVSPIFVRAVSPEIGPFASAFWRVALALPLLCAWARLEGGPGSAARVGPATWLAGAAFAGDLFFWHLAILGTTVANATFFATTAPVFVILLTWLALGRAIGAGTLAGLALCLAGGAALIGQSVQIAPERLAGDLYGIVTACFFGLYFLAVARAREGGGAGQVTFALSLVTAAILLVVAVLLDGSRFWPQTGGTWTALLALACISHAGGQGLLSVALGRLPAVFSSLVIFLEAMVAAAAGWAILGEALTPLQFGGGALILLGIWAARPRAAAGPA